MLWLGLTFLSAAACCLRIHSCLGTPLPSTCYAAICFHFLLWFLLGRRRKGWLDTETGLPRSPNMVDIALPATHCHACLPHNATHTWDALLTFLLLPPSIARRGTLLQPLFYATADAYASPQPPPPPPYPHTRCRLPVRVRRHGTLHHSSDFAGCSGHLPPNDNSIYISGRCVRALPCLLVASILARTLWSSCRRTPVLVHYLLFPVLPSGHFLY